MIIGGGISGELILAILIISFPIVLFIGSPISLWIHSLLRSNDWRMYVCKLIIHAMAGFLLVLIFVSLGGGIKVLLNRESIIFYLSGIINSVIYFIIFNLFKRTGDTNFN